MSTIWSRTTLALLAMLHLTALVTAEASQSAAEDREWSLAPRFFNGAQSDVHVEETKSITTRHAGGHKKLTRSVCEAKLTHTIAEVRGGSEERPPGAQRQTLTLTLEHIAFQDDDPLRPLRFDLHVHQQKPIIEPEAAVDVRLNRSRQLLGKSAHARTSEGGALSTAEGDPWMGTLLSRLYADRPEGRVRVGATWSVEEERKQPGLGTLRWRREYELTGIEERGVRQVARIAVSISAQPALDNADEEDAPPYELISCRGSGSRHIDLVSGALTGETAEIKIELESETTTLVYESELTTTVRSIR